MTKATDSLALLNNHWFVAEIVDPDNDVVVDVEHGRVVAPLGVDSHALYWVVEIYGWALGEPRELRIATAQGMLFWRFWRPDEVDFWRDAATKVYDEFNAAPPLVMQ